MKRKDMKEVGGLRVYIQITDVKQEQLVLELTAFEH